MERETDQPEVSPAKNSRSAFKTEFIVALAAIVVSVMTMLVYIYQAKIMREQQHTSVWPYLEWIMSTGQGFSITVINKGVGPAIIKSTSFKLDGKPLNGVDELLTGIFGNIDSLSRSEIAIDNRVIAPSEQLEIFNIFDGPATRKIDRTIYRRIEYEICYCSIYDECWTSKGLQVVESSCD
jgi:hypothetical protein